MNADTFNIKKFIIIFGAYNIGNQKIMLDLCIF